MRALALLSAVALVIFSPAVAFADCGAFWPAGAIEVVHVGKLNNINTMPDGNGGILITPADPGMPAKLPDILLIDALRAGKPVTVRAAAIVVNASLDFSNAGRHRRLTLSTDLGYQITGQIVLGETITLDPTDQLYLRGGAIDQCLPGHNNSTSLKFGHVAIIAYRGVGLNSDPLQQLNVACLAGFSLYVQDNWGATIVSRGPLPLEEFERGQTQGQDGIFVHAGLHIELNNAAKGECKQR